jgi:hypothetical protein
MKRTIFISYRRDDTEGEAGRLFDDLTEAFGENAIFMDVDGIAPGMDFRKAIDENVSGCGILLAVIGRTWASLTTSDGHRRLDEPGDFVRLEIATALQRGIAVVPVLVHGAQMPRPDDLPDNLKDLAYRNGVEISHARWNSDVKLLVQALQHYVAPGSASDTHTVHAAVPVQLPAPAAPAPEPPDAAPRRSHLIGIAAGVAAVIFLGIGGFLYLHGRNAAGPPADGAGATTGQTTSEPPVPVSPVSTSAPTSGGTAGGETTQPDMYIGQWINPAPESNNGLARLQISAQGTGLVMHAWGNCERNGCDWGTVPCAMSANRLEGRFEFRPNAAQATPGRVALVSILPQDGMLDVRITNTFANHPTTHRQFAFQRAP